MPRAFRLTAFALAGALALLQSPLHAQSLTFSLFDRYLESLRSQAGIPGLAAVVVQDGQVAWSKGYGVRDVENNLPLFDDTPFPILDLTQTFASALLMQCVDRGTLALDQPLTADPGAATVRQTLLHALSANGSGFKYDPAAFAQLTTVVDVCGEESARLRVASGVFQRFGMTDSVPGRDLLDASSDARPSFDAAQLERYSRALARMAVPYKLVRGRATRSEYTSKKIDASIGLISSARDLAKYDSALDGGFIISDDALRTMWANQTATGASRPTGLGWFVQNYNGEKLVWHFGYAADAYSSLILKIPSKKLTLILLANSDGLSANFDLAQGDVTTSVFAVTFLRLFL